MSSYYVNHTIIEVWKVIFLSKWMVFRFKVYRFPKIHIFPQPITRKFPEKKTRNQALVGLVGEFLADVWVSVVFLQVSWQKKITSDVIRPSLHSSPKWRHVSWNSFGGPARDGVIRNRELTKLDKIGGFQKDMFTATWGNDPIWIYNIFQMGWFNHRLAKLVASLSGGIKALRSVRAKIQSSTV